MATVRVTVYGLVSAKVWVASGPPSARVVPSPKSQSKRVA